MKRIVSLVLVLMLCSALIAISASAADVPNILKADRKVPAELTYSYKDAADTQYTPGYVLHYMDFSKVKSWEDTGYFATKDAEFTGFNLANGVLSLKSEGTKPCFMMTGNYIPKNISDFTFVVKYRVLSDSSRYLCFVHGNTLDAATGKVSNEVNTSVRTNGAMDGASYDASQKAAHEKVYAAMVKGEWVTATFSARKNIVETVTVSCGGASVVWTKTGTNKVPADSYFGIRMSNESYMEIASIQVIAGSVKDYSKLIWPAKEGDLVQKVTETALLGYKAPETTKPAAVVPAAPKTADIAVVLAAVSAVAASGVIVIRKRK